MAAGTTDIVVRFLTDLSDLTGSVKRIDGQMAGLRRTMRRVGVAVGAAFAVRAIGDFVSAAEEAEASNRRLEQTMRNAGDATGAWAKHAEDLADQLQRNTGIDDEVIKGGQAILSTFHEVSDAAGQQSGIFDRATKAALDLSKTGFGDVDSAAKQLGKALQDPEKGLTALTRAGVTFTDAQKEQIKALIDSGDQLGAMNIILGEVENQVGGVAEKTATSGDKMRVAWNETKESLGKALLPVLQQLAPAVETLARFVQDNATWLVPFAAGVFVVVQALQAWTGAQALLNGLLLTFGAETTVLLGPIALIAAALLAVYAAVALLYAKWDQVWRFIGGLPWYAKVAAAIIAITNPISLLILIASTLAVYWNDIWTAISRVIAIAGQIIIAVINQIKGAIGALADFFGPVLRPLVELLKKIVELAEKAHDALGKIGGSGRSLQEAAEAASGGGRSFIPGFAAGGIVTRPTLALIGEAGPEAVVPLSRGGGSSSNSGGSVVINVHTTGLGADAPSIQSAVVAALRQYTTRNGPLPAAITGGGR